MLLYAFMYVGTIKYYYSRVNINNKGTRPILVDAIIFPYYSQFHFQDIGNFSYGIQCRYTLSDIMMFIVSQICSIYRIFVQFSHSLVAYRTCFIQDMVHIYVIQYYLVLGYLLFNRYFPRINRDLFSISPQKNQTINFSLILSTQVYELYFIISKDNYLILERKLEPIFIFANNHSLSELFFINKHTGILFLQLKHLTSKYLQYISIQIVPRVFR